MTEKNEATVNNNEATENNYQPRKLKLEPKELMRLSLFETEEKVAEMSLVTDEKFDAMNVLNALTTVLENCFDMTCIPKCMCGKIIGVACGNADDFENFILATMNADNGSEEVENAEAEAEGEDNKE